MVFATIYMDMYRVDHKSCSIIFYISNLQNNHTLLTMSLILD